MPVISIDRKTNSGYSRNQDWYNGTKAVDTISYGAQSSHVKFTKTWVRTPDYALKKRKRTLPDNPYSSSYELISSGKYYWNMFSAWDKTYTGVRFGTQQPLILNGGYGQYLPIPDRVFTELDGVRRNKLLSKIKNQKVNMAQVIGERHQLYSMMNLTVKRISTSYILMREGRLDLAIRALGATHNMRALRDMRILLGDDKRKHESLASHWLALQYGWKPLMSDLKGFAEQLASTHLGECKVSARTMDIRGLTDTQTLKGTFGSSSPYADATWDQIWKRKTILKIAYKAKFLGYLNPKAYLGRLGLTNPIDLAWELLPLSFVVDWFLPVGSFTNNLDSTSGLIFMGGTKSTIKEYQLDYSATTIPLSMMPTAPWPIVGMRTGSQKKIEIERKVLTDFPYPALPSFKDPFSTTHNANGLALMKVLFNPFEGDGKWSKRANVSLNTVIGTLGGITILNDLKRKDID